MDDCGHTGTGGNKTEENREFREEKYRLPAVRKKYRIHLKPIMRVSVSQGAEIEVQGWCVGRWTSLQVVSCLLIVLINTILCTLQDREVLKLKITRENVYSITAEGSAALPKTANEVTKLGEVFYKSVGPKLPVLFENRGGRGCIFWRKILQKTSHIRW